MSDTDHILRAIYETGADIVRALFLAACYAGGHVIRRLDTDEKVNAQSELEILERALREKAAEFQSGSERWPAQRGE